MSDQSLLARFKSRLSHLLGTPEAGPRAPRAPGVGTGVTRTNIADARDAGAFEDEVLRESPGRNARSPRGRTESEEPSTPPPGIHVHRPKPSVPNRAGATAREDRAPRSGRGDRLERTDRPERADRPERTERLDRDERPARTDRLDRDERPARADRLDRGPRADRPERAARPDRDDRLDRPDTALTLERPERPERGRPLEGATRPHASLAPLDELPESTGDEPRGKKRRRRRRTAGERLADFDTDGAGQSLGDERLDETPLLTPATPGPAPSDGARTRRPSPEPAPDVLGALFGAISRQLAARSERHPEDPTVNWNTPTSELTAQDWKTILVSALQEAGAVPSGATAVVERSERPERAPRPTREERARIATGASMDADMPTLAAPKLPAADEPEFVDETRPPSMREPREPREPRAPREHREPREPREDRPMPAEMLQPEPPREVINAIPGLSLEPQLVKYSPEAPSPEIEPIAESLAPTPIAPAAPTAAAPVVYGRVPKPARRR